MRVFPKSPKANGQKSVGKKPTNRELEARITDVEMMLSLGARRSQIIAAIQDKYHVDVKTVDRYVRRAKENLVKRSGKSKGEHKIESFNFYQAIALNASARPSERIRARQRIDDLLGLDEPKAYRIGDPDGKPMPAAIIAPTVNFILPEKQSTDERNDPNSPAGEASAVPRQ